MKLKEEQILALMHKAGFSSSAMRVLTREVGPYDVNVPTAPVLEFVDLILKAGRKDLIQNKEPVYHDADGTMIRVGDWIWYWDDDYRICAQIKSIDPSAFDTPITAETLCSKVRVTLDFAEVHTSRSKMKHPLET